MLCDLIYDFDLPAPLGLGNPHGSITHTYNLSQPMSESKQIVCPMIRQHDQQCRFSMLFLEYIDWYFSSRIHWIFCRDIWNGMNMNGNRYLSLAEVDKGIRDVLGLEEVFLLTIFFFYFFLFFSGVWLQGGGQLRLPLHEELLPGGEQVRGGAARVQGASPVLANPQGDLWVLPGFQQDRCRGRLEDLKRGVLQRGDHWTARKVDGGWNWRHWCRVWCHWHQSGRNDLIQGKSSSKYHPSFTKSYFVRWTYSGLLFACRSFVTGRLQRILIWKMTSTARLTMKKKKKVEDVIAFLFHKLTLSQNFLKCHLLCLFVSLPSNSYML